MVDQLFFMSQSSEWPLQYIFQAWKGGSGDASSSEPEDIGDFGDEIELVFKCYFNFTKIFKKIVLFFGFLLFSVSKSICWSFSTIQY